MGENITTKSDCQEGLTAFAQKRHPHFKNWLVIPGKIRISSITFMDFFYFQFFWKRNSSFERFVGSPFHHSNGGLFFGPGWRGAEILFNLVTEFCCLIFSQSQITTFFSAWVTEGVRTGFTPPQSPSDCKTWKIYWLSYFWFDGWGVFQMNYPYETYMRFLFFDSRKDTISSARTQSPFIEYV